MEADEDLLLVALLLLALSDPGPAPPRDCPAPSGAEEEARVTVLDAPQSLETEPEECPAAPPPSPEEPLRTAAAPGRYQVIRPWQAAEGTVARVNTDPDGRVRLLLRPDIKYMPLVGERNHDLTGGHLVVTVVPGAGARVTVPPVGSRVRVCGAYVLDTTHGWRAIEPVQELERVR